MTYLSKIQANLATNDLGRTAWGLPKISLDNSIFHGMFTYNVPITTWYETLNNVLQTPETNAVSVNGALEVSAGAVLNDTTVLRTYRNPRYEPNRGMLYSTAGMIINPTGLMERDFGIFTAESGVFFRLKSGGTLVGVIRTTRTGVTTEDEIALTLPAGTDLSKGNVYDIQYQWRGVGNYKFFVNLEEVGNSNYLGTLTELSMYNPANPLSFSSTNLGDNDAMRFGCVDVTSEGGKNNGKTYGSVSLSGDSSQAAISAVNTPVIAIRSKLTVNGLINTRDTLALLASAYGDQRAIFKIWATRDFTAITDGNSTWTDFGDGHLEYAELLTTGGTMTFDKTKAGNVPIFACRVGIDETYASSALFEDRTDIYLTPGDMFVFTMHKEIPTQALLGGVTFEFAEEI